MIFSNILKPKYINLLRIFVLVIVSIFSLTLYSCQTSYMENYSQEQIRNDEEGSKILEVKTKTDSTINLENYEARYNRGEDVILYKKTDTTYINNGTTRQINEKIVSKINLKNVIIAKIEKEKTNVPLTLLAVTGIVLSLLVIAIAIDAGQGGWLFGWKF